MRRHSAWLVAALVVAGVVAGAVAIGDTGHDYDTPLSTLPAQTDASPKTIELDPEARRVARRFIQTAVARKHLDEAYDLAGPMIRQGQSRSSWRTGDIAVIPYPVDELDYAPMKVDYSYPRETQIEVALLPREGAAEAGQLFVMVLNKVGARWVVNGWTPRKGTILPDAKS